jgi:putative nucleotidyltransferase with HDIG domain
LITPSITELLDRALTCEVSGEWDTAAEVYDRAFRRAVAEHDVEALLESATRLGHCFRQAGDSEASHDVLVLAATAAALHGDEVRAARALNGIGILLQYAGDTEAAERTYQNAREHGLRGGYRAVVGEIEQNLGILDNIRGDLHAALEHYTTGLEHLRAAGHLRGCARALNNLGILYLNMGQLDAADAAFQEALAICERGGDIVTAGAVHINRTELFLALDQPDRARASCDEGFEIASRLGDQPRRGEALKFYGIIYRTTGKLHLAEIHLGQAIEIARGREPLLEAEAQRELALVLRAQSRNREALEALNRSHALFSSLQAKTAQADINERISKLESDFLSLVRFWGESIEAKDRYTSGHCERVADYACRLASEAGIGEREIVWFRMGAFLHDLGKTEVAEEILNKPGRLTEEERTAMERHPVIGDEMLAPVEFPWDIRPMVRHHHEAWDGSGYPAGLAGETIPLPARILCVADVYDALASDRPYRPAFPHERTLEVMSAEAGRRLDPSLFDVFRRLDLGAPAVAAGG